MNTHVQKILIIDDDERNIFALKAVLTARGYHCFTASGGTNALDILNKEKDIHIALVDMMMPDIDGYELMMLIGKIPSMEQIKLIAVTAQAMPGDKEKCIAAGADEYITKPVDLDVLLNVMQRVLN